MTREEAIVTPLKVNVTAVHIKPVPEMFWAKKAVLNVRVRRPTDIRICILPATAPMGTTQFAQQVMPPVIFLTNHRRTQNREKSHFFQAEAEGEIFLSRTATGNETWIHHFETLRLRRHLFAETKKPPNKRWSDEVQKGEFPGYKSRALALHLPAS